MRFVLEIRCDNTAFGADNECQDTCDAELARILRELANKVAAGNIRQTLFDINGNRVGECGMEAGR